MRKIANDIQKVIEKMGGKTESARLNMRIYEVRERYRLAIESVYPDKTAQLHLAHTNNVIIRRKDSQNTLIVYVDDSLFAAELNAQRELIKLRLLELFGEEIDDFQIKTSRWKKYRESHPYVDIESYELSSPSPSIRLNSEETAIVNRTIAGIEDEKVRKSLERAMTADLEWKKGEKVEKRRKNTK